MKREQVVCVSPGVLLLSPVEEDLLELEGLPVQLEVGLHPLTADLEHHRVRVVPDAADDGIFEAVGRLGVCPDCQVLKKRGGVEWWHRVRIKE